MSDEQWTWRPSAPAPNAKETVSHALAWMISDRMHLEERADVATADVDIPTSQKDLLGALKEEADKWRSWLSKADSRELSKKVKRYGILPVTKRFFVGHALQNLVYKSGQLSVLYFTQGLDGDAPFTAPMPKDILEMLQPLVQDPLMDAVASEDHERLRDLLGQGADPNMRSVFGFTPLHLAALYDNQELINVLLNAGANINAQDDQGRTPAMFGASESCGRALRLLLWNGADGSILDNDGKSLLDHAREGGDPEVISLCESGLQIAK